jgi:glutamyl-tRNA reductase
MCLRGGHALPDEVRPVQLDVAERYSEVGAHGMIIDAAVDAETVAALWLEQLYIAIEHGQHDRLERLVKRWHMLRNQATKHWSLIQQYDVDARVIDYQDIVAERRREYDEAQQKAQQETKTSKYAVLGTESG